MDTTTNTMTARTEGLRELVAQKVATALAKGGANAADAWEKMKEQGRIMEDFLLPIGKGGRGYFTGGDDGPVKLVGIGNDGEPIFEKHFHLNGMMQLGDKLGIPPVWLRDRMTGSAWEEVASRSLLNAYAANSDLKTVLVRAVGSEIRGILSDRYKRLDTVPVFGSFLTSAYAGGAKLYDGAVTDLRASMEVLLPEVVEVEMPEGTPPVHIVFGAAISSSDFGKGSLEVKGFYLQGACLNGAVRKNVMREVHLGRRMEFGDIMSEETLRKDTDATRSAIGDVVRHVVSAEYRSQTVRLIQAAAGKVVDVQKEVKALVNFGLSKAEVSEVDAILMAGRYEDGVTGGPTAWKVSQGVTAIAREKDADRRDELHAIAADWLDAQLGGMEAEFEKELVPVLA